MWAAAWGGARVQLFVHMALRLGQDEAHVAGRYAATITTTLKYSVRLVHAKRRCHRVRSRLLLRLHSDILGKVCKQSDRSELSRSFVLCFVFHARAGQVSLHMSSFDLVND